jgi:hypothetical protein
MLDIKMEGSREARINQTGKRGQAAKEALPDHGNRCG